MASKRIPIAVSEEKMGWLEDMRKEDYLQEMAIPTYISHLITMEKKRRDEEKLKGKPGRPRKEGNMSDDDVVDELVDHPNPVYAKRGIRVTKDEYEALGGK